MILFAIRYLGYLTHRRYRGFNELKIEGSKVLNGLPSYNEVIDIFYSMGIISISFGLVNPKIGTKLETVKREGVDIVFAIDVSKSMLLHNHSGSLNQGPHS